MTSTPPDAERADDARDPGSPRGDGWRVALGCAALAALSIALYAQAADFDFISFDDRIILLAHPELYAADSPIDAIMLSHFPREEPLLVRDLSWWLDAQLFGFESPYGYHLGNVVWNALAVVLFALWLFVLRPDWRSALIPAALFAVVPVHVEPVAWIMGRKDLVSACISLLVLIAHVSYLRSEGQGGRRRALAYLATLLLYPLAVLGKFNALFLVPALALQDVFFPYLVARRAPAAAMPWSRMKRAALSLLPHLALAVLLYLFYSWNLSEMGVTGHRGPPTLSAKHLATLAAFLPWVVALYGRNLLDASEHSIFYPWPHTDLPMSAAELAGAGAITVAIVLSMVALYRRRRDVFFFALVFFVLMVPYANIVYIGIWVADRYVYLSSGMLITAVVWGAADLVRRKANQWLSVAAAAAVAVVLLSWTLSTAARIPVFADDVSLFGYEVERANPNMLAYSSVVQAKLRRLRDGETQDRAALLAATEEDIRRGTAHYEQQPWQRDPDYLVGDHLHYSKLLVYSTMTMTVRGAPASTLLPIALRAHEVQPRAGSAEHVALLLRRLCEGASPEEVRERSRESLRYYEQYVSMTLAMPTATSREREVLRRQLREYYGGFPHLTSEVEAVEARLE